MSTNQGWSQTPPPPPSGGGGSNAWIIVLLAVGAAMLLCCGGAGALLWYGFQQADVARQNIGDNLQEFQDVLAGFQALDGEWNNASTGAIYTVRVQDGTPQLMSIVDDDGEVFAVENSRWDGSELHFRYRVPSTSYVVDENVHLRDLNHLDGDYVSTSPTGEANRATDTWTRVDAAVQSAPAPTDPAALAAAFDGSWLCFSSDAVYTIRTQNNEPRLMSVVDDDGEVFLIQESSWDGTSLRWTYRVPSTGYVVSETVRMLNTGSLSGEYTSTGPDGDSTEGADSWIRQ